MNILKLVNTNKEVEELIALCDNYYYSKYNRYPTRKEIKAFCIGYVIAKYNIEIEGDKL